MNSQAVVPVLKYSHREKIVMSNAAALIRSLCEGIRVTPKWLHIK